MDHLRSGVQDQSGQHSETKSLLKIQKVGQAWWHVPVVPATWEAEAGQLLESFSKTTTTTIKTKPKKKETQKIVISLYTKINIKYFTSEMPTLSLKEYLFS